MDKSETLKLIDERIARKEKIIGYIEHRNMSENNPDKLIANSVDLRCEFNELTVYKICRNLIEEMND